ncbi:hypothetical protein GIB67_009199 [Kingdonia uniflora]|uniref:Aminotransferase-like plant mobile domain-containing protein n=1 Tax=Kingdonia uniflora TaxID=39325 RepID=A0A7J7N2Q7_9MAGN|nr:hypothetical protein GIB67_009199 [Kingdonia uniflora]
MVDSMGFADFCSINAGNSDNRLIHALVERWWPSTHTFRFPCGELDFTLLDFVMLTGISCGRGRELPYNEGYSKLEEAEKIFPGITSSDMRYEMDIVYARAFIAYMMGNLFFSNGVTSLRSGYLAALTNYNIIGALSFDWGTSIMEALYRGFDEVSILRPEKVKKSITRFYAVLEYWIFEYCRVGMYIVKIYDRMEGQNQHRLATMGQVYEIEASRGKRRKNAKFPEGFIGVSPIRPRYNLVASPVISKELNPVLTRSNTWTHGMAKSTRKMALTPIIVEDVAQAEELNPVLTRSNAHGKAKSKRKTVLTPIIVEDALEAS